MKNKTIIYVILALIVGYAAGDIIGIPSIDKKKTSGDVNAINAYNDILTPPEYMAFQKEYSTDQEAIARTETTLNIISSRILEFNSLAKFAINVAGNTEGLKDAVAGMNNALKENGEAALATQEAITALESLKNGEKVNLKKALKSAEKAYAVINDQIVASKAYVQAADSALSTNVSDHLMEATARDLLAGHCAVNANLAQNDAETDYWSNMNSLVPEVNMAQK